MFRLLSDPLALFVAGDPQQGPRKGEGGDNQLGEKLSRPTPPPPPRESSHGPHAAIPGSRASQVGPVASGTGRRASSWVLPVLKKG